MKAYFGWGCACFQNWHFPMEKYSFREWILAGISFNSCRYNSQMIMKEIWNVRMVNIIWKLTRVSCFCYDCIKTLSGISYSWNTVPVSCLYVRMAHHHSLRLSLLCEHVACCSWCSQEQPTSSYQRQFHLSCVCWPLERNYFEAVKKFDLF